MGRGPGRRAALVGPNGFVEVLMFGAEGSDVLPSEGALLLSSFDAPLGEVFRSGSGFSELVDIVQDSGGLRSNAPGCLSFSCASRLLL